MVDALCRAREWLAPPVGRVIDLRPADVVPVVEVGLCDGSVIHVGKLVVDDERRARHQAADRALREVIARRIFTSDDEQKFWFRYYSDTADELRNYLRAKWRHTHLDEEVYGRTLQTLAAHAGSRLWLREEVAIRSLYPTPL